MWYHVAAVRRNGTTTLYHIKPKDYIEQFPDSQLYSEASRASMSKNSHMKRIKGASLEERFGEEKANLIKSKLSDYRKTCTGWKHSEETKEKMRQSWENDREARSLSSKAQWTDERRERQRQIQKERIEKNGYHLARGKETKLELSVRQAIESLGYSTIRQKGTKQKTLGAVRYFDIFIPELNTVVECDGEWWHTKQDRIEIDFAKTEAAALEGYKIVRISDKEIKRSTDPEKIVDLVKQLLFMDADQLLERSFSIISARR